MNTVEASQNGNTRALLMSKIRAATIHLAISFVIVGVVFAVIFFLWYPAPTFRIAGAMDIVFVLVGVDLVLGPMLTLLVYKKNKPSLRFDLSVIALIQVAALAYGTYTFFQERPYYMVFAVDRFNLVSEKYIDQSKLKYDELREKPFGDVIRVFARMPEDRDEYQEFLTNVMTEGGADLESRPEYYEPYENGKDAILERTKSLSELKTETERDEKEVQRAIDKYEAEHPNLGYVPIATLREEIGMIMDMDTAEPLGVIDVDPW